MSGHSKWSTIKRKKGALDEKKGKIFSKLSKELSVAARGGSDPSFNFALRLAIDRAKAQNMPKDNIDRAIAKGSGGGEGGELKELVYEGFGPAGVAVIVTILTDNPNRSSSDVKHIFSKNGGNMGGPGAVMWQFERLGVIRFKSKGLNREDLELELIDAGAEDIKEEDDELVVISKVEDLQKVNEALSIKGITIESAGIEYLAKEKVDISEGDEVKVERFLEALDDNDDVVDVFTNIK